MKRRGKITILSKYLFSEMLKPALFCIMAITVMFISNFLYQLTDMIVEKHVPLWTVTKILLYRLPDIFVQAFPISALFATIYSLGRLVKDNELLIMRASGFSLHRILLPFIILGLVISGGGFLLEEEVAPWANHRSMNLMRQIYLKDVTPSIKENIFFKGPDNRYFYVSEVDRTTERLKGIMVYETDFTGQKGPFPRVITAKEGIFHEEEWELENGVVHEFNEDGFIVREAEFKHTTIPVSNGLENFYGNQKTAQEMSRGELGEEIDLFLQSGIEVDTWQVEYHLKMALPFASFIFVLIGAPLSMHNNKGWGLGVIFTIVTAFAYYVLQSFCRSLGVNGYLSPFWAAWIPNISCAILGIILLIREEYFILR